MQSKCIDLKQNYGMCSSKIISSISNETILSSIDVKNNEINFLVYSYDEKAANLKTPINISILSEFDIISYDVITSDCEIIVYAISNGSVIKYNFIKNEDVKIYPFGDNGSRKLFHMAGIYKIPYIDPSSIKISRNGSIICVAFLNGEILIYDTIKLFESNKNPNMVLKTESKDHATVKDISPDATTIITQSQNENIYILWDIEQNKRIIDLKFEKETSVMDCVFGRIEAVSHIYNIYAAYNSINFSKYWIVIWNCSTYTVKLSICVESKLCDSICVSNEGRYVAVNCYDCHSIDVYTSFSLQKLYTYSNMDSYNSWLCHFLPLSFSMDKLQHEFDLICLSTSKNSSFIVWLYENLRCNYSVIWPVSTAVVLIVAIFYFALQYGL